VQHVRISKGGHIRRAFLRHIHEEVARAVFVEVLKNGADNQPRGARQMAKNKRKSAMIGRKLAQPFIAPNRPAGDHHDRIRALWIAARKPDGVRRACSVADDPNAAYPKVVEQRRHVIRRLIQQRLRIAFRGGV
jgi:hypothetical protein